MVSHVVLDPSVVSSGKRSQRRPAAAEPQSTGAVVEGKHQLTLYEPNEGDYYLLLTTDY